MKQKLIDKIMAILAKADEGRNDNPHEREIAMRQANALLVKHGLSMTDITDQTEKKESFGALGRKQHTLSTRFVWESGVWSAVAELNNCRVIRTPRRGLISIWIIGRQLNCTVTKQIAEYAVNSIKREAKTQGHTVCSFGVGAWSGIREQVANIIEARSSGIVDGEKLPESTAILVIDQNKQALVETNKATMEFFPRLSRDSYGYGGDRCGVSAGKDYGRKISLNNQINGTAQRAISN